MAIGTVWIPDEFIKLENVRTFIAYRVYSIKCLQTRTDNHNHRCALQLLFRTLHKVCRVGLFLDT